MNSIDFTQTGGFPLTQDTFNFLQTAHQTPIEGLGKFLSGGAALCIVNGCLASGSVTSSGLISYNGELLPFNGGTTQTTFLVRDVPQSLVYQDGTSHAVIHNRFAEFGVGAGAVAWNPVRLDAAVLLPPEAWHTVTNTTTPALSPLFSNDPNAPLRYRKLPNGQVFVQATLNRSAAGSDTIFTLPAGYRPVRTQIFLCAAIANYSNNTERSNGTLEVGISHVNGRVWLNLSALNFPITLHLNLQFFVD